MGNKNQLFTFLAIDCVNKKMKEKKNPLTHSQQLTKNIQDVQGGLNVSAVL